MTQRWLRIALLLLTVAAAVAVALALGRGSPGAAAPQYSTSSTAWRLPRLQGSGAVSLAQFRGRPVVVDFFASWCTACRDELPEFLGLSRRLAGRVSFVGIDSEENGDGLGLARSSGITVWPLARDVGGSQENGLRQALEPVPGMPITAVYDADGRLISVRLGAETGAELEASLQSLLGVA